MPTRTTRRGFITGPIEGAQGPKLVPVEELVNSLEYEAQAELVLTPDRFASIAGSDRSVFDRLTFRPRMNVSTLEMDLSVALFGHTHFTPLLVGPVSEQSRYHLEGELETVAGAAAARTVTVLGSPSSVPIESVAELAAERAVPLWCSVPAAEEASDRARDAVRRGARAIFVTLRAPATAKDPNDASWAAVEAVRAGVDVPVVLKGVTTASEATRAATLKYDGVVVSSFGGSFGDGASRTAPIEALIEIHDAIGAELPILVDGSFRRATDVLAALILGARAVLIARPVMWALAAYGAGGVETLLSMLQYDLARCFAMIGAPSPRELTRGHIKLHRR